MKEMNHIFEEENIDAEVVLYEVNTPRNRRLPPPPMMKVHSM
jgi:hypothetical protein